MSIKLKKEHVRLSEVICSRYCRTDAEYDIIVPDVKPDVLKVLNVSGTAAITHKSVQTDKVHIQGIIRLDILYIPDGNVLGGVKAISCTQDFSQVVDTPGSKPGMNLVAEAECEIPECSLVNSRKLSICTKTGLNIKVTDSIDTELATAVESDEPVQVNTEHMHLCHSGCDADRDITIHEHLEVPSGKPAMGEILRFSVKPVPKELRLLDNKAIVKGELKTVTLFCSDDEESTLQCMEHSIPFTEILEIDGISENMTGEADYGIKNIITEITCDSDGDKRILSAEITLSVCIRASGTMECDVICDAYGLKKELVIEKSDCSTELLLGTAQTQLTGKENIAVPDYLPEIYQVCDCTGVPTVESISAEKNAVTVSGYITCNILYMSQEREAPLSGFSHILPFTHTFEIQGLCESSICDVKAETEHLSYTISGAKDIELRYIVVLSIKASNPCTRQLISAISTDENAETPCFPSMTVYFVRSNDTLWDIAKRYRTSPEAILAVNGNEKDFLKPGGKIYIFR